MERGVTADPLERFPAFAEAVRHRLEMGRTAYGDRSFGLPPSALLGELEQEALDLAGWGFVLFERIRRLHEGGCRCDHDEQRDHGSAGQPGLHLQHSAGSRGGGAT